MQAVTKLQTPLTVVTDMLPVFGEFGVTVADVRDCVRQILRRACSVNEAERLLAVVVQSGQARYVAKNRVVGK